MTTLGEGLAALGIADRGAQPFDVDRTPLATKPVLSRANVPELIAAIKDYVGPPRRAWGSFRPDREGGGILERMLRSARAHGLLRHVVIGHTIFVANQGTLDLDQAMGEPRKGGPTGWIW
jgi:hypothetical protein